MALRDGADRIDPGRSGSGSLGQNETDAGRVVDHRIGVGHGAHGGESTGGRGPSSRGDGLLVLPSRLPEVDVDVDEAGSDEQTRRVDLLRPLRGVEPLAHAGDQPVNDEDISPGIQVLAGV